MPIEIEKPKGIGYDARQNNLSQSRVVENLSERSWLGFILHVFLAVIRRISTIRPPKPRDHQAKDARQHKRGSPSHMQSDPCDERRDTNRAPGLDWSF